MLNAGKEIARFKVWEYVLEHHMLKKFTRRTQKRNRAIIGNNFSHPVLVYHYYFGNFPPRRDSGSSYWASKYENQVLNTPLGVSFQNFVMNTVQAFCLLNIDIQKDV